jgi:hypothetical protein
VSTAEQHHRVDVDVVTAVETVQSWRTQVAEVHALIRDVDATLAAYDLDVARA